MAGQNREEREPERHPDDGDNLAGRRFGHSVSIANGRDRHERPPHAVVDAVEKVPRELLRVLPVLDEPNRRAGDDDPGEEKAVKVEHEGLRQEREGASKLLNPMANMKHLYSGIYCANRGGDRVMSTYCAIEAGIIETTNGKGLYRWSRAVDNSDLIVFDLFEDNYRYRVKFRGTNVTEESSRYLLNNIWYKNI